jgi:adenine phosphoribosyltransferase
MASLIRVVPDFPKPGILFRDVTPLIGDRLGLAITIDKLTKAAGPLYPSMIVGIESRGFIFGAPLAHGLKTGFAPARKPGKLPYKSTRQDYSLEYGTGTLEMHDDAVAGHDVLIVDDLLATGGTARAAANLCEHLGARVVGFLFVIELQALGGRGLLEGYGWSCMAVPAPVVSLLTY